MLTPAPIAVASPAKNAYWGLCVASATAKIGARVESEPSIRPVIAGCTRWSRNDFPESDPEPAAVAVADLSGRSRVRASAGSMMGPVGGTQRLRRPPCSELAPGHPSGIGYGTGRDGRADRRQTDT